MTDGEEPPPVPASRRSALGLRLALAFISVALAAVALVAGLTAGFAAADVSALAARQHAELTSAIAVAAGAAWDKNDSCGEDHAHRSPPKPRPMASHTAVHRAARSDTSRARRRGDPLCGSCSRDGA